MVKHYFHQLKKSLIKTNTILNLNPAKSYAGSKVDSI